MPRYVAFLRAINVGGRRVKMEALAEIFRGLGLADVTTFIASGNVLFSAAAKDRSALERKIEKALEKELGYVVETFIRSLAEIAALAAFQPFAAKEMETAGHTVHVVFLQREWSAAEVEAAAGFCNAFDQLNPQGRDLWWLCRGSILDTQIKWNKFGKAIPGQTTARNLTMIRKLIAKHPP